VNTLLLALSPDGPPDDADLLHKTFVDPLGQARFLCDRYLDTYLAEGGSKLKLIIGRKGCGKSHFIRYLASQARNRGYMAQVVSAQEMPLFSFDQIYRQIMKGVNTGTLIRHYTGALLNRLGYAYDRHDVAFLEWAVSQGREGSVVRREIKDKLAEDLFGDLDMDRSLATAILLLASDDLGVHSLGAEVRSTLDRWLKGDSVPARERNTIGIRKAIDRYSARLVFRSLLHFLPKANVKGVLLAIDDLHQVTEKHPEHGAKYTRTKRDEFYESLRHVVDEVDSLRGFFPILSGRREIVEDQSRGIRSYEALWMRLQNEVRSEKFNRFADLIDLDHAWQQGGRACLAQIASNVLGLVGAPPPLRGEILDELGGIDPAGSVSPVRMTMSMVLDKIRRQQP
jgi:hypothetical protein